MGGIAILATILIFTIIIINVDIDIRYFALILLFLGYAFIGMLDDTMKIKRRHNEGLTKDQKFLLQFIFAAIFAGILVWKGHYANVDPILKFIHFDSPWAYFPFVCLIVVGCANAVNLTDGLDGLAASTLVIAFSALAVISYNIQATDPGVVAATAAGATLAFLWFNHYPAEVFMGDIGSMGLGSLLAGVAILLHQELVLIIIGGVFVLETISVIIQVSFFRTFKRRLFKMTPVHHHFELMGMSEPLVVTIFAVLGLAFACLGVWVSTLL